MISVYSFACKWLGQPCTSCSLLKNYNNNIKMWLKNKHKYFFYFLVKKLRCRFIVAIIFNIFSIWALLWGFNLKLNAKIVQNCQKYPGLIWKVFWSHELLFFHINVSHLRWKCTLYLKDQSLLKEPATQLNYDEFIKNVTNVIL